LVSVAKVQGIMHTTKVIHQKQLIILNLIT